MKEGKTVPQEPQKAWQYKCAILGMFTLSLASIGYYSVKLLLLNIRG